MGRLFVDGRVGWVLVLTTRYDADYLLRGRQPLCRDPWHHSERHHLKSRNLVPRVHWTSAFDGLAAMGHIRTRRADFKGQLRIDE